MKRLIYLLVFPVLLVACAREAVQEDESMQFAKVQVNIGGESDADEPDTRSLVTIEGVERFVKAALFAFDSNGRVIVNNTVENPYALTVTTTTQAFEWDLPLNVDMKIYVLENYGNLDLSSYIGNTSLRVSDLEGLMFTCNSSSALAALGTSGNGMPMSGVNQVRLTSASQPLSITVGKLFARYNFKLDVSAYTSAGYSVNGVYVKAMKSNTEVPYFVSGGETPVPSGYKQTNYNKLQVVDTNSQDDLVTLDAGGYVTLYFLENCQGTIYINGTQTPSSWKTIYQDYKDANALNKIANCSYLEFGIKVTNSQGVDETFSQRIYLGDDMRNNKVSNFNVRRNVMQTLAVSLTPASLPTEAFKFVHSGTLVIDPGQDVTVEFGWTGFDSDELEFSTSNSSLSEKASSRYTAGGPKTIDGVTYPYSGRATFTAASNSGEVSVLVTGGKNLGADEEVSDKINVDVQEAVILQSVSLDADNLYIFAGENHYIPVYGHYSDGSVRELDPSRISEWTSSEEDHVVIDENSIATGLSVGDSNLEVWVTSDDGFDEYSAEVTVYVQDPGFYLQANKTGVPAEGGLVELTVHSPSSHTWSLSVEDDYWHFSQTTGTGTQVVYMMAEANLDSYSDISYEVYGSLNAGVAGYYNDDLTLTQLGRVTYEHEIPIYLLQVYDTQWNSSGGYYVTHISYGAYSQEPVRHDVTVVDNKGQSYVIRAGHKFQEGNLVFDCDVQSQTSYYEVDFPRHAVSVSPNSRRIEDVRYVYYLESDLMEMSWYNYTQNNTTYNPVTYTLTVKPHVDYHSVTLAIGCVWNWDNRYAFTITTSGATGTAGADVIEYDGKTNTARVNGQNRNVEDVIDCIAIDDIYHNVRKYFHPGTSTKYSNQTEVYRYFTHRGLFSDTTQDNFQSYTWDWYDSCDYRVAYFTFKNSINVGSTGCMMIIQLDESFPKNNEFQWWW